MNVLVIGLGPIGMLLAAGFIRSGHRVACFWRSGLVPENGFRVEGSLGSIQVRPATWVTSFADISGKHFDLVVVATKAFANETLAQDLFANRISTNALFFAQNGLIAKNYFDRYQCPHIISSISTAGMRLARDHSLVTGVFGPSYFGVDTGTLDPDLIKSLNMSFISIGMDLSYHENISEKICNKLVINVALNGLSALLGAPVGQLMKNAHSRKVVLGLASEAVEILRRKMPQCTVMSVDEFERLLRQSPVDEHFPSMYQDIISGRTTEADVIYGVLIEYAKDLGLGCGHLENIYSMIKAREAFASTKFSPVSFGDVEKRTKSYRRGLTPSKAEREVRQKYN